MPNRWVIVLILTLGGAIPPLPLRGAPAAAPAADPAALEFFETKVRPVLVQRCHQCHSRDAEKLKGGLMLDSREAFLAGGDSGPVVVPGGDPKKSRLLEAIHYENIDLQMPPKGKLPEREIADLTKWVETGAPWPAAPGGGGGAAAPEKGFDLQKRRAEHWSWQPVRAVEPPAVKDAAWAKTAIDRFILAELEEKGLAPAKPADRRTLVRRVHFDLIGLPPAPEEVEAFVQDKSPNAFEKVVDRLLASEHFGERWARHWLDLVRYAETFGHEFDYPIHNAEQYIPYVVRALNADLPYDQFVTEHIAGDLLGKPRTHPVEGYNESILGTGFWFFGEQTHAPVDVRLHQADRIDNQIDVFGKTFLGLTINCARCHDHKFDAISAKDYYALYGVLESTRIQQAYLDPQGKIAAATGRMLAVQREADKLLTDSLQEPAAGGEATAAYLVAARDVMLGAGTGDNRPAGAIVFEDFEKSDYAGWRVEGTAFGPGPQSRETIGTYQGDVGAAGKFFVNSHNIRGGGDVGAGDRHTGKLTSRPFTIERRFIELLIGGGGHEGKTCLNVVVDGKVVRTAVGPNDNRMRPARIDVADLKGKEARIEIVDAEPGPWGNIGVDQIVFVDTATAEAAAPDAKAPVPVTPAAIDAKAKTDKLDPGVLRRVVESLGGDAVVQPAHPLRAWRVLAGETAEPSFAAARDRLRGEARAAAEGLAKAKLFEDFDDGSYADWFPAGQAFGDGPTRSGRWDASATDRGLSLATPGVAHSGTVSNRLRGVLRSKSFVIENKAILYRMAGKDARIRLVVDGYTMDAFNALLFEGFNFAVNTEGGRFQWHRQDVSRYLGHRAHIEIIDDGDANGWVAVDEIRFADEGPPPETNPIAERVLARPDVAEAEALAAAYGKATAAALEHWRAGTADAAETDLLRWGVEAGLLVRPAAAEALASRLTAQAKRLDELSAALPPPAKVLAAADGDGVEPAVFIRGSHKKLGDPVPRRFLDAISGPDQPTFGPGSGRLDLAKRVVDPGNPLTARVMANRVWHHLFGRGIVASTDDFGVMGQPPTHPELLDHLAAQFVKDGWSIKKLIRAMVLTRTYQMSTTPSEASRQTDPQNNLLQHMRLRRLEGEAIRDAILAVSGRLDRRVGGPFVEVYLTEFMEGRGRPAGGPLDGAGRRSLYTRVRRNFLSPMMLAFDTPIPFSTMGRRSMSNVPAQALILLNDPFVAEQCRLWAERVLAEKDLTSRQRIERMYAEAFSRPPSEQEGAAALAFLESQAKELGLGPEAAGSDPRPWADLAHVLVNVKEFIFLN